MRVRSAAGIGVLITAALLLAASPRPAPIAAAAAPDPGLSARWSTDTPANLGPLDQATAEITITAPSDQGTAPVVVDLQLANATADPGVPTGCRANGAPPSGVSPDRLQVTCNLGPLDPDQSVTFAVDLTAGSSGVLAVQAGPYVNAGTVLTHTVSGTPAARYYRLLSSPDFLNADVADLAKSKWADFKPNQPNSWNRSYATALEKVLSDWESFHPQAVTVPGDLVNGRWMKDPDHLRAFGPVGTKAQRIESIRRAGHTYFSAWLRRFKQHHLPVYAGLGDHDIGDNPWRGSKVLNEKRENAPLFRSMFAKYFTKNSDGSYKYASRPVGTPWEGTAYAVRPDPNVQIVMLDVFRTITGDTIAEVADGQLAWVEQVLADAQRDGVDWIVVEGHTPILGPVRRGPSSGLMYKFGSKSALWSLFKQYGVDVYLSGEVHASSGIVRDGIVQLSHGGNVGYGGGASSRGGTSFVVSDFSSGRLVMNLYSWDREHNHDGATLWQMAGNRIPEVQRFVSEPIQIGSVTITNNDASTVNDNIVIERSGLFKVFDPSTEPGDFSVEWLP